MMKINGKMAGMVLGAFLIAGVTALLIGLIASKASEPRTLEEDAYPIEVAEVAPSTVAKVKSEDGANEAVKAKTVKKKNMPEPILAMLAEADIARGQKLSKACAACHKFDQGAGNGVGPNLWNIVGRKKQSVSDFKYSGTLNSQGGDVWTYAELNKWLWKPKKYASGTKMSYAGMKKTKDRAALIAWLHTLSASPKALPSAADIAAEAKDAE